MTSITTIISGRVAVTAIIAQRPGGVFYCSTARHFHNSAHVTSANLLHTRLLTSPMQHTHHLCTQELTEAAEECNFGMGQTKLHARIRYLHTRKTRDMEVETWKIQNTLFHHRNIVIFPFSMLQSKWPQTFILFSCSVQNQFASKDSGRRIEMTTTLFCLSRKRQVISCSSVQHWHNTPLVKRKFIKLQ